MKLEIQFLVTYKEIYHENTVTTFKHLCKVSANAGTENVGCRVKQESRKGSFQAGCTHFLNPCSWNRAK